MKERLKVFGKLGLLWIIFFEGSRLLFLIYNFTETQNLNGVQLLMPLWLGLRMDLSMAGYWLIIPGLLLTASFLGNFKWVLSALRYWFYLAMIFSCAVIVADLELYRHWGFRMDTTPLFYAGREGMQTAPLGTGIILILLFVLICAASIWGYHKTIPTTKFEASHIKKAPLMLLCTLLLFIPIRSSFRVAPLNTGVVFFDNANPFPNHAGINVVWNFLKSVISDSSFRYPENLMESSEAETIWREATAQPDSVIHVFNTLKPNIILIILEGFTAKIIEPLGGKPDIAPNLNNLCNEGILFDSFYASGDRTDKGLISILSGYPAQPKTSIIKFPNKTGKLPSLPRKLKEKGYHVSFVYGGDIGFANMESYLTNTGFSNVTEDDDFDLKLGMSKWGVPDEYVFERTLQELDTVQSPFFKALLTLSSHEPFDVPFEKIKGADEQSKYLNACSYTDSCLGAFINSAKTKPWWKNTLIILTADHGHRLPGLTQSFEKEKFHIPMLWLGGSIDSVRRISTIGSQLDIAATLLVQLNLTSENFEFSRNIFGSTSGSFCVYSFNNGFGFVSTNSSSVYDFDLKNYVVRENTSPEQLKLGMAFMQKLFEDYNSR